MVSKNCCLFEFELTIWSGYCQRDKHDFAAAHILTKSIEENGFMNLIENKFLPFDLYIMNYTLIYLNCLVEINSRKHPYISDR